MDFFNSPFFSINKRLLSIVGLWPHQNYLKKIIIRTFFGLLSMIFYVPHFICLYLYVGKDPNKVIQSVANIFYILEVSVKMIMSIILEDKIQRMFENIVQNWKMLHNEDEVKILVKHSENGRFFTIFYIIYIVSALVAFITLPLLTLIIDKFAPLNEPRPKSLILNGEYLVDHNKHYMKVYMFESLTCILTVLIIVGMDSTYVVCVQQCIGLMDVVKMRLSTMKNDNQPGKISKNVSTDISLIQTVQFHQKAIDFAIVLESTYAINFLFVIGINIIILSIGCVIILMNLNNTMEVLRFTMLCFGLMMHTLYLSWPGQQMIDISSDILQYTYTNMWYELSMKTKKMLLFMMLKCKDPCKLTAGGIYVMNIINCGAILKTSLSYITVFSSML